NRLVIVTEPGNPNGIDSLADLATAGTISLCVDTAPCGKFADRILADASVTIPTSNITRGTDVRSTLTAVTDGDAVAGIVYVTDAKTAADRVDTVAIAEAHNVTADYPIATLGATTSPALARAFEAYVLSERGRSVLEDAGFLAP
ncbi:MAG TPA: substrate-binding domain-containing protein, partial [Microthrixaceae bacterium]|nr:substrate-binding domain-containing protein [Microthrixaceae bacterium]